MSGRIIKLLLAAACMVLVLSLASCKEKAEQGGGNPDAELSPIYPQQAQMLETALKDDPNNLNLLIKLANLYYDWGRDEVDKKGEMAEPLDKWNKAVDYYKRALLINPSDVNVRVDMATLLQFMQKSDESLAEYQKAISIDPKHPQARINYILALAVLKQDYKGAVREYEALLKAAPEQAQNEELKQSVEGFKQKIKEAKK